MNDSSSMLGGGERNLGRESSFGGSGAVNKDWMSFQGKAGAGGGGGMMERPMTASQNNMKIRELENELKNEKRT